MKRSFKKLNGFMSFDEGGQADGFLLYRPEIYPNDSFHVSEWLIVYIGRCIQNS